MAGSAVCRGWHLTRTLWTPKFPECAQQCASCPFREGNDAEFKVIVDRLREKEGLSPAKKSQVDFARASIRLDVEKSGDFMCHNTVYDKQGRRAPSTKFRQCVGATAYHRGETLRKIVFVPPGMKTKRLWVGAYGGHYDIVIFFMKKPTTRIDETRFIDLLKEKENIVASMDTGDFDSWFGGIGALSTIFQKNGRPKDTEIEIDNLIQLEITAPFDRHGRLIGFEPRADGY